jgi:hypothetical protein
MFFEKYEQSFTRKTVCRQASHDAPCEETGRPKMLACEHIDRVLGRE